MMARKNRVLAGAAFGKRTSGLPYGLGFSLSLFLSRVKDQDPSFRWTTTGEFTGLCLRTCLS